MKSLKLALKLAIEIQ